MRTPGVEQSRRGGNKRENTRMKAEDRGTEGDETREEKRRREKEKEIGIQEGEKSVSATLSYVNSGTPGGKGRMQISPVAIWSGPNRGSSCKHVFFTASENRVGVRIFFFFSVLFFSSPLVVFVPPLLFIGSRFRETPIDQSEYIFRRFNAWWRSVCRHAERFSWQISTGRFTERGTE